MRRTSRLPVESMIAASEVSEERRDVVKRTSDS
jgi:hypothetical protein